MGKEATAAAVMERLDASEAAPPEAAAVGALAAPLPLFVVETLLLALAERVWVIITVRVPETEVRTSTEGEEEGVEAAGSFGSARLLCGWETNKRTVHYDEHHDQGTQQNEDRNAGPQSRRAQPRCSLFDHGVSYTTKG